MCTITVVKEAERLNYYEIHFDCDPEIPYRVWADTKEHAEEQARGIANYMAWIEDPLKPHQLPK